MLLNAWVLAALTALPVYKEDIGSTEKSAQLERLANAIAQESQHAPLPPREWAKLLITVGFNESALSLRITAGNCKPKECDRGRARGIFQIHRNSINRELWAKQDGDIELQAHLASDQLERGYWTCSKAGVPWLVGTINGYAGRRCSDTSWPGLHKRIATYGRL